MGWRGFLTTEENYINYLPIERLPRQCQRIYYDALLFINRGELTVSSQTINIIITVLQHHIILLNVSFTIELN